MLQPWVMTTLPASSLNSSSTLCCSNNDVYLDRLILSLLAESPKPIDRKTIWDDCSCSLLMCGFMLRGTKVVAKVCCLVPRKHGYVTNGFPCSSWSGGRPPPGCLLHGSRSTHRLPAATFVAAFNPTNLLQNCYCWYSITRLQTNSSTTWFCRCFCSTS